MVELSRARSHTASRSQAEQNAEDAALVAAAKRDRAAFAPLYLRYADPIYRYCLRWLGGREAAEDATAQIFTKVLIALPAYRLDGPSFRSWLFAVAHNVLVDAERVSVPVYGLEAATAVVDSAPGPEAAALAAEGQREVRTLLAAVAPEQRRVLELRLAGLTTAEVADALGRSQGAIRATQFRAAVRLRALLGIVPTGKEASDVRA